MLSKSTKQAIDRCVDALIAGEREIEWPGGPPHSLITGGTSAEIDAYAAERLPTDLWGVGLRLVWKTWSIHSSYVTFCEGMAQALNAGSPTSVDDLRRIGL